jgi:uncharacterized damage-inducible protein DinB
VKLDVLPWLEYRWPFDTPVGLYRPLCERLRGTPARLEETLQSVAPEEATARADGGWSIQQHAGHLWIVEPLWQARVRELLRGEPRLTAADMSNAATESARLNDEKAATVLAAFRSARAVTLQVLDPLTLEDAARAARHPRLDKTMRLVDLCLFAAEHDDHHLAMIRALLRKPGRNG